jgi:hypothetical protein
MLCRLKSRHALMSAVIALAIVTLSLPGCADIPRTIAQAQAWRDDASAARDRLNAEIDALASARPAVPDGSARAAELDAALAVATTRAAALDAAVRHADLILTEMTTPADGLTRGVSALSPFLPAPAQGPALLGAALLATLLRAHQVKKGAGSIVASIEKAMADPDFQAAFDRHAATIRSIQTPTARRIVDEITRSANARPIRSPI